MTENKKTAVYIRLSMEDGNVDGRTKLESDSVTSQRILLKSFVIDQLGSLPYLGWLNWLFPVGDCLTIMLVWLGAVGLFYLYSIVMRWLKVIGD